MKISPSRRPSDSSAPERWFWYWVNERHAIYLRRKAGERQPWSSDPIFQRCRFTNVSRRFDRATRYIQREVRQYQPTERLFRLALFRVFNRVSTYELLSDLAPRKRWSVNTAIKRLDQALARGESVCSPVWISIGGRLTEPGRDRPHRNLLRTLDKIFDDRQQLVKQCQLASTTLSLMWFTYHCYPYVGPFLALELVADLVEAGFLDHAADLTTWTHVNKGAIRGLMILDGIGVRINTTTKPHYPGGQVAALKKLESLLVAQQRNLRDHVPKLIALDLEHCLCEFAKYHRISGGNTYAKTIFTPSEEPLP